MNKGKYINIAIIGLLLAMFVIIDSSMPPKINWTERYDPEGKLPFDTKVFIENVTSSHLYDTVIVYDRTFYELYERDSTRFHSGEYLFLSIGNAMTFDEKSITSLISFMHQGNEAMLIYNTLSESIEDTIGKYFIDYSNIENVTPSFRTANGDYSFKNAIIKSTHGIHNFDTQYYDVCAYYVLGKDTFHNMIKGRMGRGAYLIHSSPILFTNYFLLHDTNTISFVNQCLSHTTKRKLILILNSYQDYNAIDGNPLKYILTNAPLKYAWYLCLAGILLYLLFRAKRKQRVVPILHPEVNTTVAYTKTIGNLMYDQKNYTAIAHKRINYFLSYIRTKYAIDTTSLDEIFIKTLSLRSGKSHEEINTLIQTIIQISNSTLVSKENFVLLDKLIFEFKKQ